jgi:hypothetical protein
MCLTSGYAIFNVRAVSHGPGRAIIADPPEMCLTWVGYRVCGTSARNVRKCV